MSKILLVGLGGTGSKIVVDVENLINQLPEEARKDITLETLGIDTDNQYLSEIKDHVSSLQINTDVVTLIKNIAQFPSIEAFWNPNVTAKDTSNGAGGVRILSKVSVYRHADKIANRVGEKKNELASKKGERKIYVFVVGSLFGGTGSGAFIDVANIIANKLRENLSPSDFRITGHFFLPSILPTQTRRNFENTYAALQEYEYILKCQEYEADYTDTMTDFKSSQLYHNVFLISGFTHQNLTLPRKPGDFYDMVAHKIYYEIISQKLFKEFMGKLYDVHILADSFNYTGGKKKPTAFSSFGMSVLTYPYDNIRRYFSYKIAASILDAGFLGSYEREDVEKDDVNGFISKNFLDKLDREIRQNKNVAFDLEQIRFTKSDYDRKGRSLESILDDVQYDYDQMKYIKFKNFYKTVDETIRKKIKDLKIAFISVINRLIKSYGFVRAEIFIDLLLQNLSGLEKNYREEFKKFERISTEAALGVVDKELQDVRIRVGMWWPIFKRKEVMKELDEFIEEANFYVDNNSNEIINEYAAILLSDFMGFIKKFYVPGGKQRPAGGFLERIKLQTASEQRSMENEYREVGTYITEKKSAENEYKVVQNLKTLDELNALYNTVELNPSEQFTLFTNQYMPDLDLDPDKIANMPDKDLEIQLDKFNVEEMEKELSEKLLGFSYGVFDDNMSIFRPENIIKSMSEEEIIKRIDDMIKYCSPFLSYKEHIGRIEHVDNTLILIQTEAHKKIEDRIKRKYGGAFYFLPTDDVDFLMIMKYSHGYDLNSLTEIESIARKYKALPEEDRRKRHINTKDDFDKMEPILVRDIKKDAFLYFGCGMFFKIGEDFPIEFGAGRGKANPDFKDRFVIDRTESGINYKFLDWTGQDKMEQDMGKTILDAFKYFENNGELIDSIREYESRFIAHDSKGHKERLENTWNSMQEHISKLKDSTKSRREEEMELFRNMSDAIDQYLADMN